MTIKLNQILNIAHRGFSAEYPENTLLAFDEGMRAGADGFECDLRLTADGRVVIFHDDDLQRLCNARGTIETLTLQDVKNLEVKGREPIPTLEELLTSFHTTRINLEIKASTRESVIVEEVLRVLSKVRPQGEILFSSFAPGILRCLQAMDEERRLGGLGILVERDDVMELFCLSQELHPTTWNVPRQILGMSDRIIEASQQQSITIPPLWVWTVDQADDWTAIRQSPLPFAAVITNQPKALAAYLRQAPKS